MPKAYGDVGGIMGYTVRVDKYRYTAWVRAAPCTRAARCLRPAAAWSTDRKHRA